MLSDEKKTVNFHWGSVVSLNRWFLAHGEALVKLSRGLQFMGFPGGAVVKNPPANAGNIGLIPGSERFPGGGNGNPLQYSCLQNPMDRGVWRAPVHGVTELDTTGWLSAHATGHGFQLFCSYFHCFRGRVSSLRFLLCHFGSWSVSCCLNYFRQHDLISCKGIFLE